VAAGVVSDVPLFTIINTGDPEHVTVQGLDHDGRRCQAVIAYKGDAADALARIIRDSYVDPEPYADGPIVSYPPSYLDRDRARPLVAAWLAENGAVPMSEEDEIAARLAAASDTELATEAAAVASAMAKIRADGRSTIEAEKHLDRIHAERTRRTSP
jgi:hypothetical protein